MIVGKTWLLLFIGFLSYGPVLSFQRLSKCVNSSMWNNTVLKAVEVSQHLIQKSKQTLKLFRSDDPLDWCKSYHLCRANGLRLATMEDVSSQDTMQYLNYESSSRPGITLAWVSARRMDTGQYKWVDNGLQDYNVSSFGEITGNYLYVMMLLGPGSHSRLSAEAEFKTCYQCSSEEIACVSDPGITWYEAQNLCALKGKHLAVYDDIQNATIDKVTGVKRYWVGLYYRPWVWITRDNKWIPVVYTSWPDDKGPSAQSDYLDCLTLNLEDKNKWQTKKCTEKTNYFICKTLNEPVKVTILDLTMLRLLLIIVGSVIALMIFILILSLGCMRRGRSDVALPENLPSSDPSHTCQNHACGAQGGHRMPEKHRAPTPPPERSFNSSNEYYTIRESCMLNTL